MSLLPSKILYLKKLTSAAKDFLSKHPNGQVIVWGDLKQDEERIWFPETFEEFKALVWRHILIPFEVGQNADEIKDFIEGAQLVLHEFSDFKIKKIENLLSHLAHFQSFQEGRAFKGAFKGKRAVICGAGPSIETIERVLKQGDLLLAAGSGIKLLVDRGISPDFGVIIDPEPYSENYLKTCDIPCFFQPRTSSKILKTMTRPPIFMGSGDEFPLEDALLCSSGIEPYFFNAGWNAATFAYAIAQFLGCEEIVQVGVDLKEKRKDFRQAKIWYEEFQNNDSLLKANESEILVKTPFHLSEEIAELKKALSEENPYLREAELICLKLYDLLLIPLWQVFQPLFEGREGEDFNLHRHLFFQQVVQEYSDAFLS